MTKRIDGMNTPDQPTPKPEPANQDSSSINITETNIPDDPTAVEQSVEETTPEPDRANKPGWLKHNWAWVTILLCLLIGGAGASTWYILVASKHPQAATTTPEPSLSPTPTPTPITKASPLTGLPVTPAEADRPIVSVIIENHPDARPQSGLGQAGVVYEALAEGGITRFQAFFLDQRPKELGPIRSLRTYFVDWGMEFNAPVVHAGGNMDALDLVQPLGMKDLNALVIGPPTFYRTNDRYAPHNLYTSSDLLDSLLAKRGYGQPSNFTLSPRKADSPSASPSHPTIHIDYSYSGYQVDYKYDGTTNDYARTLAGAPHIDRNTGTQIHVKNVVVEYMPTSYGNTRIGEQTVIMQTVGSGKAIVFRDGEAVVGTWSKASHSARTKLLDANGVEIPLDNGNTWYSIVPIGNNVNY